MQRSAARCSGPPLLITFHYSFLIPQLPFVHHTSSSLFSSLIACERCPLWFCLHAKALSGRECRKVSCVSVCSQAEGAAYSLAEDKPVSPWDMTRLSPAQRISALSVRVIARGGGVFQDCRGEGWREKKNMLWLCSFNESLRCVRASFSQQRDPDTLVLSSVAHLTHSLLCLVKNVNKRNQTVTFFLSFSFSNAIICCRSLEVVYPPCKGCSLSVCNLFKMMPLRPLVVFVQFKKGWLSVVFMLLYFFQELKCPLEQENPKEQEQITWCWLTL